MSRPRDSQRERLYRAERSARDAGGRGCDFASVEEMQRYTDGLLSTGWWQRRYPKATWIKILPGGSGRDKGHRVLGPLGRREDQDAPASLVRVVPAP